MSIALVRQEIARFLASPQPEVLFKFIGVWSEGLDR